MRKDAMLLRRMRGWYRRKFNPDPPFGSIVAGMATNLFFALKGEKVPDTHEYLAERRKQYAVQVQMWRDGW